MRRTIVRLITIGSAVTALMLAGCGSGAVISQPTVSGVAATGAPINGQVRLKDSAPVARELIAPTGSNGSFVFNVAGLTPPFILKVDWTAAGGSQSLVSFASAPGTANITPLSQVIVANAAGVSDPTVLYDTSTPAVRGNIAAALKGATAQVTAQLKPLFDAYGVTFDPLSGPFAANHVGLDAMLDAVRIDLAVGNVTVSNRASGAVIFTAPATNLGMGSFMAANMPSVSSGQGQPVLNGTALYAVNCAGCHGPLASSSKTGASVARIQTAVTSGIGGMGSLAALTSPEIQAIATALGAAAPAPVPSPVPVPVPVPIPPAGVDGAALYSTQCAGCHGALASSSKKGITVVRLQTGITNNLGGMGSLSALSSADMQAIVSALSTVTAPAPTPAPTPAPAPVPVPVPADGVALYSSQCAGCHGVLAVSAKIGATAARIQTAISNNIGGMGGLTALNAVQVQAIADTLTATAPAPTPAPSPACGSCHAIPPASGHHSTHRGRSCATCHGSGYSSTTVNTATHNNGVKNLVTTIGWSAASRSCSNSCHGSKTW